MTVKNVIEIAVDSSAMIESHDILFEEVDKYRNKSILAYRDRKVSKDFDSGTPFYESVLYGVCVSSPVYGLDVLRDIMSDIPERKLSSWQRPDLSTWIMKPSVSIENENLDNLIDLIAIDLSVVSNRSFGKDNLRLFLRLQVACLKDFSYVNFPMNDKLLSILFNTKADLDISFLFSGVSNT